MHLIDMHIRYDIDNGYSKMLVIRNVNIPSRMLGNRKVSLPELTMCLVNWKVSLPDLAMCLVNRKVSLPNLTVCLVN